jgi:hypothetical protein
MFWIITFYSTILIANKGKWTGFIGDENCGVKGNDPKHAACAQKCVKDGAKPVFVVGDKVYAISNADKVEKFVGTKVTITGTITNDVLEIDTVK